MTAPLHPHDLPELLGIPLSDEQISAATAPLEPQLIVAGAGTGKTTVMAARVVWLVATGQVDAADVLGLTFTNKAAAELSQRIRTAVGRVATTDHDEPGEPTVLTYHAFAGRLITQFGALLGLEADQRMLSDGQRARLAYRVACHPLQADGLSGSPQRLADLIRAMDDTLADLDIDVAELDRYDADLLQQLAHTQGPRSLLSKMVAAAAERRQLAALVAQFREAKLAAEVMDFSDQVRLGSELSRHDLVPARLRRQFRVVLLDEYQDTSRAQRRTLQSLFGDGHAVTAVGDPCQAIYGWRGASVTNIDEFPTQFRRSDGQRALTMPLTVNRRSAPQILIAANGVATELRSFHEEVRELRAPQGRSGGQLTCALLASADDEVIWLGDRLSEARARHEWHDMAVLCRSNDQVAAVVGHLHAIGVPAHVSSRRDLLALPEVETVTSLLRVLVDPHANPEVLHHLIGPRWRIGPRDLSTLATRARDLAAAPAADVTVTDLPISLVDAVHDPGDGPYSPEARDRLAAFANELEDLTAMADRSLPDLVAAVVDLLVPGIVPTDSVDPPGSLSALIELAQHFRALDGSRTLPDFVAYLADCRRFGTSPQDPGGNSGEGIAVMTMHAAKGLEFPLVALPFLSDGVFPAARGTARWVTSSAAAPPVAPDEPDPALHLGFPGESFTGKDHAAYVAACRTDDRRDEDRLAYVAITRAQTELIASGHWWGPTQKTPRGPSNYLLEVREACRRTGGQVDTWQDEPGERDQVTASHNLSLQSWPRPAAQPSTVALARQVSEHPPVPLSLDDPDPDMATIAELVADRQPREARATLPGVVSASAVVAWLRDPEAYLAALRRPMPRRPSQAAERGVAFHSWMEHRVGQQVLFELSDDSTSDTEGFAEQLARTAYADRTAHAVEQPFVISVADLVVTGRIDAVFAVTDDPAFDWEVVDWKTGCRTGSDPAQLVLYRSAWSQLTGCPPERIRGTFVYLAEGRHVSYDDLVDADDLVTALPGPA